MRHEQRRGGAPSSVSWTGRQDTLTDHSVAVFGLARRRGTRNWLRRRLRLRDRRRPRGRGRCGCRRRHVHLWCRASSSILVAVVILLGRGVPLNGWRVIGVGRVDADILLVQLRRTLLARGRDLVARRDALLVLLETTVSAVFIDHLVRVTVTRHENETRLVPVSCGSRTVLVHSVTGVRTILFHEVELVIRVGIPAKNLVGEHDTILVGTAVELDDLEGDGGGGDCLDATLGVSGSNAVGLLDDERRVPVGTLDGVLRDLARVSPHGGSEGPCRFLTTASAVELGIGEVNTEVGVDALLGGLGDSLEVTRHRRCPDLSPGSERLLLGERRSDGRCVGRGRAGRG